MGKYKFWSFLLTFTVDPRVTEDTAKYSCQNTRQAHLCNCEKEVAKEWKEVDIITFITSKQLTSDLPFLVLTFLFPVYTSDGSLKIKLCICPSFFKTKKGILTVHKYF